MAVLRPHLAINVTDVGASMPFYNALLGVEPVKVKADYVKYSVSNPALNLTLNAKPRDEQLGAFNHAGIEVESTDDVLAARLRLTQAGLATFDELDTSCCYAKQDKIWVHDPDGTPWEIFTVHGDIEDFAEQPPSADEKPESTPCCSK